MRKRQPQRRAKRAQQSDLFEVAGDELFFVMGHGTVAGEGLYIGHAPGNAAVVVLAKQGMPGTEFNAADCTPTGHKVPDLGHQLRKAHLAQEFRNSRLIAG